MGKTKDYLRYVHEATFGIVASSQADGSARFLHFRNTNDRYLAVPASEDVIFWDLKTRQPIIILSYEAENASEVTTIDCHHGGHPRTNLIAVGYANGHIRVFEYESGTLKTSFTGHRTAISALKFDKDGSRLASGSKDCTIVVWDIPGEKGMFSLKGHKNIISKLAFMRNEQFGKDLLISSSVDAVSTIKFWDLQTQHCFCTIPGQANGVWSFALLKDGRRLITGSASPELKIYSIEFLEAKENLDELDDLSSVDTVASSVEYGLRVKHLGNILRNTSTSNKVQDIVVDESESLMICHSNDRNIEVFGIRNDEDALSYAKKQAKKERRRQLKRKAKSSDAHSEDDDNMELDEQSIANDSKHINSLDVLSGQAMVDCEINQKFACHKLPEKVKALAMVKVANPKNNDIEKFKVAVMSAANNIETFYLEPRAENRDEQITSLQTMESLSHRSDVRSVSISADRSLIMTCSIESLKIWRSESRQCICTIDVDYATCCLFAEAQHIDGSYMNRFALVGTKQGKLQILDLADATIAKTITVTNDQKSITSMYRLPDRTGIVVGSNDGQVRFYNFFWIADGSDEEDEEQELELEFEPMLPSTKPAKQRKQTQHKKQTIDLGTDRTMEFQEGVTNVRVSANAKFLAVALLDSTVRVHFLDTFKYFLTLYGHKFPVTAMDISDDSNLIVTGSPDKNIKIWGLDFGDCHKSIFAHDDVITCVKFVPKTHYVFSCARDRAIKQWDCDHFIKIQTLKKHQGEVWSLDISSNGKLIVTGSHDKSIRLYRKTDEILIPSEEEETEREIEDERNVYEKQDTTIVGEVNLETGFAAKMTIDTVKSTDRLIEAIDVFVSEQEKDFEHRKLCEQADRNGEPRPPQPEHDPLLLTTMTSDYHRFILEILRRIKSSELEEILLTLPFDYVRKLLAILVLLLEKRWDVELLVRCATFLMKVNFGQIAASPAFVPLIQRLKVVIMEHTYHLRDCTGFNLMALDHLKQNKTFVSTKLQRRNLLN